MSLYKWDGTGIARGFWTNWDEDEVNKMQNDLSSIKHMEHLKEEIIHLKTLVKDTSTGHIRTAIGVLEDRIKELTYKPQPKRLFSVTILQRGYMDHTSYSKQFENANDAWDFYDSLLNDTYWFAQEPVTIRK